MVASPTSDPNKVTIVVLYCKIAPHSGAYSQFSTYNNMHSIYMTTTVSYFKNGPQIGNNRNKRNRDRDNDYRDGTVSTMKRYTRRRRGGDRRNKNKRTEYSRRRRR